MGKLIRNGIEYGGGNGTDIFKVTQAEYDALEQAGTLVHNALYVITDAPNLNPTASDIEYSSGVSVADELTSLADKEIKYKDYNATLAIQSGISPFTTFCGVNVSDIYTNNDILGFYVKEPSWDNPTPCNINGYTIRVYGFKAEAIEVRVIYKKKQV